MVGIIWKVILDLMSLPKKESPKTPDRNELGFSAFKKLAPRKWEAKLEQLDFRHQPAFLSPKVSLAVQAAVDEAVLDHQVSIASNNLFFTNMTIVVLSKRMVFTHTQMLPCILAGLAPSLIIHVNVSLLHLS